MVIQNFRVRKFGKKTFDYEENRVKENFLSQNFLVKNHFGQKRNLGKTDRSFKRYWSTKILDLKIILSKKIVPQKNWVKSLGF